MPFSDFPAPPTTRGPVCLCCYGPLGENPRGRQPDAPQYADTLPCTADGLRAHRACLEQIGRVGPYDHLAPDPVETNRDQGWYLLATPRQIAWEFLRAPLELLRLLPTFALWGLRQEDVILGQVYNAARWAYDRAVLFNGGRKTEIYLAQDWIDLAYWAGWRTDSGPEPAPDPLPWDLDEQPASRPISGAAGIVGYLHPNGRILPYP